MFILNYQSSFLQGGEIKLIVSSYDSTAQNGVITSTISALALKSVILKLIMRNFVHSSLILSKGHFGNSYRNTEGTLSITVGTLRNTLRTLGNNLGPLMNTKGHFGTS